MFRYIIIYIYIYIYIYSSSEVCLNAAVTTAAMQTSVDAFLRCAKHSLLVRVHRRAELALSRCSPRQREAIRKKMATWSLSCADRLGSRGSCMGWVIRPAPATTRRARAWRPVTLRRGACMCVCAYAYVRIYEWCLGKCGYNRTAGCLCKSFYSFDIWRTCIKNRARATGGGCNRHVMWL
jgi:hypothetical protein